MRKIDDRVWKKFSKLLDDRFAGDRSTKELQTTEDSIRYLFFYAITKYGKFDPNRIILEYKPELDFHNSKITKYLKDSRIDTLILKSENNRSCALEFKFHRKTNNFERGTRSIGNMFNDIFRLHDLKKYHRRRLDCYFVYVTDEIMNDKFEGHGEITKWYNSKCKVKQINRKIFKTEKTIKNRIDYRIPICKIKNIYKCKLGSRHYLTVTQVY